MLKYIIFGAGKTGETALNYLGYERVLCFVDNYKSGTELFDKPVRSFYEVLEMDIRNCIIVVASEKFSDEIEKQLIKANITNYFIFRESDQWDIREYLQAYTIYRKWEIRSYAWILAQYPIKKYKNIVILGTNRFIHYLILEIGVQCNISNIIGIVDISNQYKKGNVLGVPFVMLEETIDRADCLIVNVRRAENKILGYIENSFQRYDVIDIYDIEKYEMAFHYPDLEKYHNIHKGERIWLIGNGPSLNIRDLEILYKNGEICFGFNRIYKIYAQTKWRANYLGITDFRMIEGCADVMNNGNVFVADEHHKMTDIYYDKAQYFHLISEEYYPNVPRFSENIVKGTYWGYSVAFDIGIQFAYYMGAKEVYLLGMDNFNVGKMIDVCNHFTPDYFSDEERVRYKNANTEWKKINKAYEKAELFSRQNGFRIYNATRGGKLEIFERIDFDGIFK